VKSSEKNGRKAASSAGQKRGIRKKNKGGKKIVKNANIQSKEKKTAAEETQVKKNKETSTKKKKSKRKRGKTARRNKGETERKKPPPKSSPVKKVEARNVGKGTKKDLRRKPRPLGGPPKRWTLSRKKINEG